MELYTCGRYRTGDCDFLAPLRPELAAALGELGFEPRGHSFLLPALGLWIEFPGSFPEPGLTVCEIEFEGTVVRASSAEDICIDRLRAFLYWRSTQDGANALLLLQVSEILTEMPRLRIKAEAEPPLGDVLEDLLRLSSTLGGGEGPGVDLAQELRQLLGKYS